VIIDGLCDKGQGNPTLQFFVDRYILDVMFFSTYSIPQIFRKSSETNQQEVGWDPVMAEPNA
jgi:hypothetical protein